MATAIEYGLIAAGISVAIIAVVQGLGTNLKSTFQEVSRSLGDVQPQTPPADWAAKCTAYKDLKITYPDVYAYLERHKAQLPKCAS